MTYHEFRESLSGSNPPEGLPVYLKALWFDAKGNWRKAHDVVQELNDDHAAWIHAYLHRKEGDMGNADYWYSNAGRKRPGITLEEEWESIVRSFIPH